VYLISRLPDRGWSLGLLIGIGVALVPEILEPRAYLCSRGSYVTRCRRLRQASRHRVDAKAQSFPKRGHIKVRGSDFLLPLAIFGVRVAPKAHDQRCAGNLPADSPNRMSQMRRAATEIEIGQTDHFYAVTVEAHDVRGRHGGIRFHAASQPMFFKQLD
jgi:hypothetical protein